MSTPHDLCRDSVVMLTADRSDWLLVNSANTIVWWKLVQLDHTVCCWHLEKELMTGKQIQKWKRPQLVGVKHRVRLKIWDNMKRESFSNCCECPNEQNLEFSCFSSKKNVEKPCCLKTIEEKVHLRNKSCCHHSWKIVNTHINNNARLQVGRTISTHHDDVKNSVLVSKSLDVDPTIRNFDDPAIVIVSYAQSFPTIGQVKNHRTRHWNINVIINWVHSDHMTPNPSIDPIIDLVH